MEDLLLTYLKEAHTGKARRITGTELGRRVELSDTELRRRKLRLLGFAGCEPESAPLLLLSPRNPLRWAFAGSPFVAAAGRENTPPEARRGLRGNWFPRQIARAVRRIRDFRRSPCDLRSPGISRCSAARAGCSFTRTPALLRFITITTANWPICSTAFRRSRRP